MSTNANGTILVVDDTPTNLSLIFDALEGNGYRLLAADSGLIALKRLQKIVPDLILLDVMMPEIDGFETCARIKTEPHLREVPIIFLTALDDPDSKVRAFEAGAVDYVTKPIQHSELLARVRTHLHVATLQAELRKELAEKQEMVRELDAYAHTVAHDLKNPLTGLIGMADLLLDEADALDAEARRDYLLSLRDSGAMLLDMVNELLTLSTINRSAFRPEPVDMARVVKAALFRVSHLLRERHAEIDVDDGFPATIGQSAWLEDVWSNLLSNAIKYGGQPARIHCGSEQRESGWQRFYVRDQGPGLSPEQQAAFFGSMGAAGSVTAEGHGLGLSIVRRIVDKIGGRSGVDSEPGRGATFYFELPLARGES
ncbi:MAG: hybrid sensor histidine kinase/response regulator [Methylotetracoccus sp.]